ncbi:MAG: hypothetical protein RL518_1515 [Pseudomonadota bacterium]
MRSFIVSALVTSVIGLYSASTAVAAPTASIGGGATTIRLTQPFTTTLSSLNISVSKVEESITRNGAIVSPVIEGVLDRADARGEVEHSGGIRFGRSPIFVRFMNFNLETTGVAPVITAEVVVNNSVISRQPVFDVVLPTLSLPIDPARRTLSIRAISLTLRSEAADVLNSAFTTSAFVGGTVAGRASTFLVFGRSPQGILRGRSEQF